MTNIYGNGPVEVEPVEVDISETMSCLYLPVKIKGSTGVAIPDFFLPVEPVVEAACLDFSYDYGKEAFMDHYVYLTVKAGIVPKGTCQQRPGWHCDGFMTEDINYIWYDNTPTEFLISGTFIQITQDHQKSYEEFEMIEKTVGKIETYPCKTLLWMDERIIHRPAIMQETQMRAFVKVSFSRHIYALKGNTLPRDLKIKKVFDNVEYLDRMTERNCPARRKDA